MPRPPHSAPTIKDVARHAGVSFGTVGKILRGERRFKSETVEKVRQSAKALGYRSNRAAAILGSKGNSKPYSRNEALGYVAFESVARGGQEFYRRCSLTRAEELGYTIEAVEITHINQLKPALKALHHRGVEGLILSRIQPGIPWDEPLWDLFSLITVGRHHEAPPISCVRPDVMQAVRLSFEKLLAAGCHRVGAAFHQHQPRLLDDRDRVAAYLESWHSHFPEKPAPRIYDAVVEDYEELDAWVRRERLDGVIAFSAGDYLTLVNRGWRIPEDLQVAGLTCSHITPHQIAGVCEEQPRIYTMAVDLLDRLLRFKIRGITGSQIDHLIPVSWRDSESVLTRPRPARNPWDVSL